MPLKTADEIIGPALDEFYVRRPKAFKHINLRSGVYWHPFAAQRAQAAMALQYAISLIQKNRLEATGQDLRDYVASEFTDPPSPTPTYAEGAVVLSRPLVSIGTPSEVMPSGDIPKGTRFKRAANLTTQIPVQAAEYETLTSCHFDVGQLVSESIPVRATSQGDQANHPVRTDTVDLGVTSSSLFDQKITVSAFEAAGGSTGPTDEIIRRFARAYGQGQYGPNDAASAYGALAFTGIGYFLTYDNVADGSQRILVADSSWASSSRWVSAVQQSIYDLDLIGFGCRVNVYPVRNKVVAVEANVVLRDWNYANGDTLAIDEAIRKATRRYFDDRPDWNIWKSRALRNAITVAHPHILKCSSVVVKDVNGNVLSEITNADYTVEQFHYYLANNAVTITYSGPT